jgi:hypothetical protein
MPVQSEITCLFCQHKETESIPAEACLFFYECQGCHKVVRPNPTDCCVFCSFGRAPCSFKFGLRSTSTSVRREACVCPRCASEMLVVDNFSLYLRVCYVCKVVQWDENGKTETRYPDLMKHDSINESYPRCPGRSVFNQ